MLTMWGMLIYVLLIYGIPLLAIGILMLIRNDVDVIETIDYSNGRKTIGVKK